MLLDALDKLLDLDEELNGPHSVSARCKRCGHEWQIPWDGRSVLSPDAVVCPRCKEAVQCPP